MSDKIEAADDLGSTAQKIFVALGLLSSAIKSGEPWSQSCEDAKVSAFEATRKLLAELTAQRVPAQGEIARVPSREEVAKACYSIEYDLTEYPWETQDKDGRAIYLRYADAVLALLSAPQAQGWRPIETAPKDGTRILAWHRDWETSHTAQWFGSYWGVFYKTGPFLYQPTHWQPLPSPPLPASASRGKVEGEEK